MRTSSRYGDRKEYTYQCCAKPIIANNAICTFIAYKYIIKSMPFLEIFSVLLDTSIKGQIQLNFNIHPSSLCFSSL